MKVRFTHASERPADELEELFRFAYEQTGGLAGSLAVRFADASKKRDGRTRGYSGMAADRRQHGIQRWARQARFSIAIKIPTDDWAWWGEPHICGHAAHHDQREAIREAHERGEPRFGRWPIHVVWDWREAVVLVAAHELYHVLGWDRGRDGAPEVACEEFAARVLAAYRGEHRLAVAATFGPDAGPNVRSGADLRSGLTNVTVTPIMGEPINPDPEEDPMSTTKTRNSRRTSRKTTPAAAPAAAASTTSASPSIDEGLDQALAQGIKAAVKKTEFKTAPSGSYTAVKADGKPIGYLHPVTRKGVLVHLTISAADAKQLGVKGVEAHAKGAVKAKVYVAKTDQVDAVVAAFAKAAEPEVVKA